MQDNLAFSVRPEGMGGVQRAVFTFFLIEREREGEGERAGCWPHERCNKLITSGH